MIRTLLQDFERVLRQRNPVLAERLQPGLPENRVRRMLKRAKVEGAVDPVVSLFGWKNGSRLDPNVTQGQASPFPNSVYMFMDLELMLGHFLGFKEFAVYNPEYLVVVERYFPVFWDGSTGWLAVDLEPRGHNRVVIIDPEGSSTVQEAYTSFVDFLKDAIRANEEDDNLTCFQPQ